jgi:hypothetical protein
MDRRTDNRQAGMQDANRQAEKRQHKTKKQQNKAKRKTVAERER